MKQIVLFVFLVCIGATWSQQEEEIKNKLNEIGEEISKLPGAENLPVDPKNLPTAEEAEALFKKKCEKIGGPAAYERAKNAKDVFQACIQKEINTTVLQAEVEEAKPKGELDRVFAKYCGKVPILKQCTVNFTNDLDDCLEDKEKESKRMLLNITDSLSDFICFKDGDRIAMFIAEGGPECLSDKQEQIQACANKTIGQHIPSEIPAVDNLPMLILQEKECDDIKKLQDCVVNELQKCKDPTPANVVESLFKFVIKVTPCKSFKSVEQPNGAPALLAVAPMIIASLAIIKIV